MISRILIPLLALMAAACGFTPLYGTQGGVRGVDVLAGIEIAPIDGRIGQQARNALIDRMHVSGASGANYRLVVTLTSSNDRVGLRRDLSATRGIVRVTANYQLQKLGSDEAVLTGETGSSVYYDVDESDFAALAAARDAESRALTAIADDLVKRVLVGLKAKSAP